MKKWRYSTQAEIKLHDFVTYAGQRARVVFIADTGEFSDEFKNEAEGNFFKTGIGLKMDDATLFHLDEIDEDLKLLRRKKTP